MKYSLASYLKAVSSDIPGDLISTENLDRLCSLAQHFPAAIAYLFGFESSLSNPEPVADLFLCTKASQGGRDWLAGDEAPTKLPSLFKIIAGYDDIEEISSLIFAEPSWRKIREFCLHWANPNSPLHRVEDIWLEFDFDQTSNSIPLPSLFFDAEEFKLETDYRWLAEKSLSQLKDTPLSAQMSETFIHCLTSLPLDIKPFQIGVLLPRQQQVRIYIPFVSYQQLLNYLAKLHWPGKLDVWEYLLPQMSRLVEKFQLQIELQEKLSSNIAIELYPQNQSSWEMILNHLTSIGFCVPEKKNALLAYSGTTYVSPSLAPINLSKMSQFFGEDNQVIFRRRLAYLKMTYQPETPIEFKAYLGVIPAWQKR